MLGMSAVPRCEASFFTRPSPATIACNTGERRGPCDGDAKLPLSLASSHGEHMF